MSVKQAWLIVLPFDRPPLTANQRMHWRKKALVTRTVRMIAKEFTGHIPPLVKCRVQLIWLVTDKVRRDVDNVVPTLKALCDGLVDAGIVRDDTPKYMEKLMPVISRVEKAAGPKRMQLIVEEI